MTTRRAFITLLGGAAATPLLTPRAARAQQVRRVGILMPYPPTDAVIQERVRVLRDELARLGWRAGVNLQFDVRWTTDNMDLVRANAAGLLEQKPDVVVATGGRVIPILMAMTKSIPIIIPGAGDPVLSGYAESLARPGRNITGFAFTESTVLAKILEILKQITPATSRVAFVYNPDNANAERSVRLFEGFARALAIEPIIAGIHTIRDIDRVVEALAQRQNGAAYFHSDLTTSALRDQIAPLLVQRRLPAIYASRDIVAVGGLISYDADRTDLFRRAASYVDRVLRGEQPQDLPFQLPTKYQLTINLKTARAIGLEFPTNILALADEVIE